MRLAGQLAPGRLGLWGFSLGPDHGVCHHEAVFPPLDHLVLAGSRQNGGIAKDRNWDVASNKAASIGCCDALEDNDAGIDPVLDRRRGIRLHSPH
mmetsp:Transcript_8761/g.11637  ORF Transcript_8761/g.11637 Transcript_8761/m.11637 type:complete len:95 (-) Transcript_8761:332-616(-)